MLQVALDVSPRCHGLRLEGFELSECRGIELVGDDAEQVGLERQFVDDGERAAAVTEDLQCAAVGTGLNLEKRRRRLDPHTRVRRHHHGRAIVQTRRDPILQVGRGDRSLRIGVHRKDGSERR